MQLTSMNVFKFNNVSGISYEETIRYYKRSDNYFSVQFVFFSCSWRGHSWPASPASLSLHIITISHYLYITSPPLFTISISHHQTLTVSTSHHHHCCIFTTTHHHHHYHCFSTTTLLLIVLISQFPRSFPYQQYFTKTTPGFMDSY